MYNYLENVYKSCTLSLPGTPFMVRLQEHLKYFVIDKISNDPLWQGPQVYLSGHEVSGCDWKQL